MPSPLPRNVLTKKDDAGWGPNAVFRFPKEGGTGAIWTKVAKLLPEDKQRYNTKVVGLDLAQHTVTLDSGKKIRYQKLLSTIPLDLTLRMVGKDDLASELNYSSSHIIGIGLRGVNPHDLKCWLYYPEDDCPFYRCTIFSHYAESNTPADDALLPTLRLANGSAPASSAPKAGPYWSLMFEVSESVKKPVDLSKIVEETIQGAINVSLCGPDAEIVSIYHRRLEHGYPTPHLMRDGALAKALPMLNAHDVWSRGRFGSYKYEVANQDHSCIIGVEAVDNMLFGTKEFTLNHPSLANEGGKKNMTLKASSSADVLLPRHLTHSALCFVMSCHMNNARPLFDTFSAMSVVVFAATLLCSTSPPAHVEKSRSHRWVACEALLQAQACFCALKNSDVLHFTALSRTALCAVGRTPT